MRIAVAVLVVSLVAGCGSSGGSGSRGTADCAQAIRHNGTVYVEAGFSDHTAEPWGKAEQASCNDTSEEGGGLYFAGDPDLVPVLRFTDISFDQALATRLDDDTYVVYLSKDLTTAQRRAIVDYGLMNAGDQ